MVPSLMFVCPAVSKELKQTDRTVPYSTVICSTDTVLYTTNIS